LERSRACRSQQQSAPITFQAADIITRVKKLGDLFAPVLELKQKFSGFPAGK
jgi:hypothetical protein